MLRHVTLALFEKKTGRKHPVLESLGVGVGCTIPGVSDLVGLSWGMRISDKFPRDANGAGLRATAIQDQVEEYE